MFKNASLARKMGFGFGLLVVVAAIIGGASWYGSHMTTAYAELYDHANMCLDLVNKTGALRRDFAINGFAKKEGQQLNAAEQWEQACSEFVTSMHELTTEKYVTPKGLELVRSALTSAESYKTVFADQKAARRSKDDAFSQWSKVGWAVSGEITNVVSKTVEPAKKQAIDEKDLEKLALWSSIGTHFDEDVVQPFLLLRVRAVYLLATDAEAQWQGYCKQLAAVRDGIADWTRRADGHQSLVAAAGRIDGFIDQYEAAGAQYYAGMNAHNDASDKLVVAAGALLKAVAEVKSDLRAETASMTTKVKTATATLTLFGIVAGVGLAIGITVSITRPVRKIINALASGSEEVTAASTQVADSGQQLAEGATEQASSLEETSAALEEITSMTRQNTDNAHQADLSTKEASALVEGGERAVAQMSEAIEQIRASAEETAGIIKTIDEIAFQTNLLALNAAVEAARAGEAGKGFAVVAEEVRSLAQRSAEAAKNTAQLLETSKNNAATGVQASKDVAEQFKGIQASSVKVASLIGEISAASTEQAQGLDQINTAVADMDTVVQQSAANAEESASAAEELSSQAQELNAMVAELVTVVEGANHDGLQSHAPATRRPAHTVARPVRHSAYVTAHRQAALPAAARKVSASKSPEEIIPLDDGDLSDF